MNCFWEFVRKKPNIVYLYFLGSITEIYISVVYVWEINIKYSIEKHNLKYKTPSTRKILLAA
ncbi:MAG: hypothetical protein EA412_14135 [Chitinophagaceae bacterium]|nr:MAG: hypothetical protein EA412_14135 [Chitinophagaceae bacterium]